MVDGDTPPQLQTPPARSALQAAWADLGTIGRALLAAIGVMAVGVALLAQTVPAHVEQSIVSGHFDGFETIGERVLSAGLLPSGPASPAEAADLDEFVEVTLLGDDTVGVTIWAADGTVLYSDQANLIGEQLPIESSLSDALSGRPTAVKGDSSQGEGRGGDAPVWRFFVPVEAANGVAIAVVEVEHLAEPFDATVAAVRRYVTVTSLGGVVLAGVALLALLIGQGRRVVAQQRRAETMFGNLVRARAEERAHIVGTLHDDIGQPLYRIHYELQDMVARTDDGISHDLRAVDDLVLEVDGVLRTELKTLRHGAPEELRLDTALYELAELTEAETDLKVEVDVDAAVTGVGTGRIALFRAAREALINVRKHADASYVAVTVRYRQHGVALTVADNGHGNLAKEGIGLAVVRERLEALGGTLKVTGRLGRGTTVRAWLPSAPWEEPE